MRRISAVILAAAFALTLACSSSVKDTGPSDAQFTQTQTQVTNQTEQQTAEMANNIDDYVDGFVVALYESDTVYFDTTTGWWVGHFDSTPGYESDDSLQFRNPNTWVQYPCIEYCTQMLSRHYADFVFSDTTGDTTKTYEYENAFRFTVSGMQQSPSGQLDVDGTDDFQWHATMSPGGTFSYEGSTTVSHVLYDYTYDSTLCDHTIDPHYPMGGAMNMAFEYIGFEWTVTVTFDGLQYAHVHVEARGESWDYDIDMTTWLVVPA